MKKLENVKLRALKHKEDGYGPSVYRLNDVGDLANEIAGKLDAVIEYINKKEKKQEKVLLNGVELKPFSCPPFPLQFTADEMDVLEFCLELAETAAVGSKIKKRWKAACESLREKIPRLSPERSR